MPVVYTGLFSNLWVTSILNLFPSNSATEDLPLLAPKSKIKYFLKCIMEPPY